MHPAPAVDARYRSLDVWRGVACLMVLIDHVAIPWFGAADTMGAVGVEGGLRRLAVYLTRMAWGPPLFFVMSGYCIAASTDSLRRKGKSPSEFLIRRLWRTFPAYWVALGLTVLILAALDALDLTILYHSAHGWLSSPSQLDLPRWIGNLTLTETWRPRVWGHYGISMTGTSWTLCFQEQFYFVCFLAVLLAPRKLYGAWAVVTILTVTLRGVFWDIGWWPRLEGFFPVYWHEFAIGLAVYWRLNVAVTERSRRGVDAGLLALALAGWWCGDESTPVAALFGLTMIVVRPYDARLAVAPSLAPIRACGRRCYSIYLTHLPICILAASVLDWLGMGHFWAKVLVGVPVVSLVALGFAWGFFHLVESRFVNAPSWKPRLKPAALAPAAA